MQYKLVLHSLGILLLAVVALTNSPWAWLCYGLFMVRVLALKEGKYLLQLVFVHCLLGTYFLYQDAGRHSVLTGSEEELVMDVAITDVKVEGNLLSFQGTTRLNEQNEKVQVFYMLGEEVDQKAWLDKDQSFRAVITGTLEMADENQNFHLFNYRTYLKRQDIYWIISPDAININGDLNHGQYWLANQRQAIINWLETIQNPTVSAYTLSLFFNKMDSLEGEVLDAYQAIGLIHLFSISGFHVQYFLTFFKKILLRLGITVESFDYFAIAILLIYTVFLGWPYGMIRSFVAYTYNVLQKRWGGQPSSLVGTSWSMILLLMIDPRSIFTLSFQLTYALSYTILFTGKFIQTKCRHSLQVEIWQSFICSLVTIPFLTMTYFEFSWVSLILNYGYSWLFATFLFPGLLLILLIQITGLGIYFTWLQAGLAYLIEGIEMLALFAEKWTWFQWVTGRPQIAVLVFFVVTLLMYLAGLSKAKVSKSLHGLLALSLVLLYLNPYLHRYGQVGMLAIGQGDTFFLEMPYQRKVYLIDLAGKINFTTLLADQDPSKSWQLRDSESIAERQIIPALKAAGTRTIDGVFLTHGDFDHIGSFGEIAKAFKIETLYLPIGMDADTESLTTLQEAIEAGKNPKMKIIWLKSGDQVALDQKINLQVLAPDKSGAGENADSLVLYGRIGLHDFLFTGDIDGAAENALPSLPVDILKVAHHGSDHSTPADFIERTDPKIAWISVGKDNRYGHPADRVVDDLEANQTKIYRTDTMGAVHYIYWPKSAKIDSVQLN